MGQSKEHYRPQVVAANGLVNARGPHMGGFLATTAGTITITDEVIDPVTGNPTMLVNAMPVAVGWNRIPLLFMSAAGGYIQLGGGASGSVMF